MVTWGTATNFTTTATTAYKSAGIDGFTNNRAISSNAETTGTASFEADPFYNVSSSAYPAVMGLDSGSTTNAQIDFGFGGLTSANNISVIEGSTTVTTVSAFPGDIFNVTYNFSSNVASYYKNSVLITTTSGHSSTSLKAFCTAYYSGDGINSAVFSSVVPPVPSGVGLPPPPIVVHF